MAINPYEAYKQQSILTMTRGEMLNKLYEEVVKQLSCAEVYLEKKDYAKTNDALQRSQRILNYLKETLNFQYEIANNLAALYDFFLESIVSANVKKSAEPIKPIIPMLEELREAFVQADKKARLS